MEELERDLTALKAKPMKTPTDEEFIRRAETELLPKREEESRLTRESITEMRERLGDLWRTIEPWQEEEKARKVGEEEEKRVKGLYKELKKEMKKKKK